MAEFKRQETTTTRGFWDRGNRVTTQTYTRKVDDETGEVTTTNETKKDYKPDKS